MGSLGTDTQIQSIEKNAPKEPTTTRSLAGDILVESNPAIAWARNQQAERKDHSTGADPEFKWQSPRTKELLKDLTPEEIKDLSGSIDNYESLRAGVERTKDSKERWENINERAGVAALPLIIGTSMVTDPTVALSGSLFAGAKLATSLKNMSKIQKTVVGMGVGATDALIQDTLYQNTMMTDKTEDTLFAAAFGTALGGVIGRYAMDLDPKVLKGPDGKATTTLERVADLMVDGTARATKEQAAMEATTGRISSTKGSIVSVGGFLHSHKNPKVNEFAQEMSAPTRALHDEKGNVVITPKRTATETKELLGREQTNLEADLDIEFQEGIKAGEFTKKQRKEFENEAVLHYTSARDKAEHEFFKNIKKEDYNQLELTPKELTDLKKAGKNSPEDLLIAKKEKYIRESPPLRVDYHNANHRIQRVASRIGDYYNTMATRLTSSDMKGMEHIKTDGHWSRFFDVGKAEQGKDVFVTRLAASMRRYHTDKYGTKIDDKEVVDAATSVYDKIIEAEFFRGTADTSVTKQTDTTNRRTLEYYTSDMHDFLKTDINSVTTEYSRKTSGRIALQEHLGFESITDFKKYLKDLKKENPDLDENTVNNMQVAFDTIAGTRDIPNSSSAFDTTMRLVTKAARVVFSPGFAASGMAELANPMMTAGFMKTVEAIVPSMKATFEMLKGRPLSDPLMQEMLQLHQIGDIISAKQLHRYDTGDTEHNPMKGFMGGFEKLLDKTNHGIHKFLGLGYITEVAHTTSVVSTTHWLQKLAAKGSVANGGELKTLARLGYSEADLVSLNAQFTKHAEFNEYGTLLKMNAEAWDKATMDKLVTALNRESYATVLKPDGITMPMWYSDPNSPMARISGQFLRFPMAAHEQLGMRSISEANANKVVSFVTTSALFAAIGMLKDLNRADDKKQYDLDTEEGQQRLMLYSLGNTPQLALGMLLFEKGANAFGTTLTGGRTPGVSGVVSGPSGSMVEGAFRTTKSLVDPEADFKMANSINPLSHIMGSKIATDLFLDSIGQGED